MKRYKYFIYTILASVLTTSCIHGNDEQSIVISDVTTDITVSEARSFYENDIVSRADTESSKVKILSPGDYTPQWDNAKMSQNSRIACVDVPIISTYRYRAIRSEFSRGHANAYKVEVSQKLVIVKDRESGAMASYLMSLIPDKEFAAKHKGDISNLFLNANDRGKYSGAIFYTHYGLPVNYVHYTDGREDCNISTLGDIDQIAKAENFRNIMKNLVGIKFKKTSNILSRGEDSPGDWGDGLGGIDIYVDDEGCVYIDVDGDGIVDMKFALTDDNNIESLDQFEDGGGGAQGESDSFYVAMGNKGLNKIYTDLCKEYLRVKKLKLWKGEYILQDSWINEIDTIIQTYKSLPLDYYYDNNKKIIKAFGADVRDFWRDYGYYGTYWIRDKTVAVIVYCDENFSGDFIDTVSVQLDDTTIIVKKAIENTNVNGVSKFIVGLTIK